MKPIPELQLRREDVILHRALDRDVAPVARPVTPIPLVAPAPKMNLVPVVLPATRSGSATRPVQPAGKSEAGALIPRPALPAGADTRVVTARVVAPQTTTVRTVSDPRPAPTTTARKTAEVKTSGPPPVPRIVDPTTAVPPQRTPIPRPPAVPTTAAPPLGRTVSDPAQVAPNAPFLDLGKVRHLDGPATFRSPSWN